MHNPLCILVSDKLINFEIYALSNFVSDYMIYFLKNGPF